MLPFQSCRISSSVCRMEKSVKEIDYCMSVAGRQGCQDGTRLFFLLINFFLSIVRSFFFPKMGKNTALSFLSFRVQLTILQYRAATACAIYCCHIIDRSTSLGLLSLSTWKSKTFNQTQNKVGPYRVPSELWLRIIGNGKPSLHNIGHKSFWGIHLVYYTKRSLFSFKELFKRFL